MGSETRVFHTFSSRFLPDTGTGECQEALRNKSTVSRIVKVKHQSVVARRIKLTIQLAPCRFARLDSRHVTIQNTTIKQYRSKGCRRRGHPQYGGFDLSFGDCSVRTQHSGASSPSSRCKCTYTLVVGRISCMMPVSGTTIRNNDQAILAHMARHRLRTPHFCYPQDIQTPSTMLLEQTPQSMD